jgi:hypothetical protein
MECTCLLKPSPAGNALRHGEMKRLKQLRRHGIAAADQTKKSRRKCDLSNYANDSFREAPRMELAAHMTEI